ncbi:TPA: hypothetical protein H1008_03725 [archaeon]|uniref:Uncharacterized protein n=1 Tax=uncultured marine group II/III euryarchaeote KM3_51_D01 TaxID=1456454 RepID=A0A075H871_9EURY|nr:hypothetical protein [uncultured marine group II/III euryarchaeote KM3_51_D01]HIK02192.1 hypothetical protein [Candidatus Undinarchaeales archaeon SRR5007147.bin71]
MSSKKKINIIDLYLLKDPRLSKLNKDIAPVFTRTIDGEFIPENKKMKLLLLIEKWMENNPGLLTSPVEDSEMEVGVFLEGVSDVINNIPSMDPQTFKAWQTLRVENRRRKRKRKPRKG